MNPNWCLIDELTPEDLARHPVWEYVVDDPEAPDTAVRPVETLPVNHLVGRSVSVQVRLANGLRPLATLSNISLRNPLATQHFLCVRIERNGQWFDLARYHDVDFEQRGPAQLSQFLGLTTSEVFPIEYDIGRFAIGEMAALRGEVTERVDEELGEDALIELALEGDD